CNKFENVDFFVEFWSESGDFGPGTLVHGPWRIARGPDLTVLDYGVGFTDSSNTYQVDLTLPQVVTMDTGWVTVYADIDPTQPDCYFRWPSDAQGDTGMDEPSGDNRSWRAQVGEIPGDMALCMSPPGAPGACCDQEGDFSCSNGVDAADCAQPKRWVQETSQGEDVCARFDGFDLQQCGIGACCHADGSCTEDTKADCETASGVWSAGAFCAQTAHDPDGHHCPPANDECTSVSPTARGDFSETFTGRNDGTTADVAEVGAAAWEAFTNPNPCSDITIDYCTTDPMFTAIATPYLLPSCTGYDNRIESSSSSTTDRESGDPLCCLDDPPGYDANYMISFENVPAGDFWIPVRTQTGSTGAYTIHVTGTDCTIDDPAEDCNDNGFHDVADVVSGTSADCNSNMVPDECECGDFDDDGVTGLDDYALFQGCYSGPVTTVSGCDCTFFDNDLDSDVDLYDYWWFQQCRGALACA
ncbi:MAG: hypothetical protein GY842_11540, partial [bacterium]|nr:hypothetical protein [bacterium]